MKKIYFLLIFFYIGQKANAQNQLQGYDPFPSLGGVNDITYSIDFDSQNHPWVGSGYVNAVPRQLASYDGNTWDTSTWVPPQIYNSFRAVKFDHNNILWVGGGMYFASYDNGNWVVYHGLTIGLPDSVFNVGGIVVDHQNNKWFLATAQPDNYLVKWNGVNFTTYNMTVLANDSNRNYMNGLFVDSLDNIYIKSSYADSIKVFDGTTFSQFNFYGVSIPGGYQIRSTAFDKSNNDFWTLLQNNSGSLILGRYVAGNWTYTSAYLPAFNFSFARMTVDNFGKVWMGDGTGLVCFDGTAWQSWTIGIASFLFDFTSDMNGNIWMTCQGGLSGNNTVYRFLAGTLQSIQGNVWYDVNGNGVQDTTDAGMHAVFVGQQPDNWASITSDAGNYQLSYSDSLLTYNVSVTPPLYWVQTYPTSATTVNPSTQSTIGINFGITPIPGITDLRVTVTAENVHPGWSQIQNITYYNAGTDTISDTITYIFNPQLNYVSSIPPADVVMGDTLKWAFSNLLPLGSGHIDVTFHLDTTAVIGDTLMGVVTIDPMVGDSVPSDNQFTVVQQVRGPFDPNEKTVFPEGDITFDQRLSYTVFFQNTGNDTAYTVIIKDTLDSDLDVTSFRLEGSSFPVNATMSHTGVLEFRFSNIMLPDSNVDELRSHGFVKYSIMPKANSSMNTSIDNTASIYFDFNSPIVTNTTHTTITSTVAVNEVKKNVRDLALWPNPSSESITIKATNISEWHISIRDLQGAEVLEKDFSGVTTSVTIRDLPQGIYMISMMNKDVILNGRFVKIE